MRQLKKVKMGHFLPHYQINDKIVKKAGITSQIAFLEYSHCPISINCMKPLVYVCARVCVCEGEVGKGSASLKNREKKKEKQTDTHLSILAGGKE